MCIKEDAPRGKRNKKDRIKETLVVKISKGLTKERKRKYVIQRFWRTYHNESQNDSTNGQLR